jgi:hypothetical protein
MGALVIRGPEAAVAFGRQPTAVGGDKGNFLPAAQFKLQGAPATVPFGPDYHPFLTGAEPQEQLFFRAKGIELRRRDLAKEGQEGREVGGCVFSWVAQSENLRPGRVRYCFR